MGIKIFGIDMQSVIAQAIPPSALPAITLRKWTAGTLTPGALTGVPNATFVDYPTRGIVSDALVASVDGAQMVSTGFRSVMMIAQPLAVAGVSPDVDDEVITAEGTLRIVSATHDPATAQYTCRCRG